MKFYQKTMAVTAIFLLVTANSIFASDLYKVPHRLWKPAEDNVYLQEVAEKIPTKRPVLSVAEYEGSLYALMDNNIFLLKDGKLDQSKSAPVGVKKLISKDGSLWALSSEGLFILKNKKSNRCRNKGCFSLGPQGSTNRSLILGPVGLVGP